MTWLYGDSSDSPLEVNFIDFLRYALDFAVAVLLAEDRIGAGRDHRVQLESEAEREITGLEVLRAAVTKAAGVDTKPAESRIGRCAAGIAQQVAQAVKSEVASVKSALAGASAKIDADAAGERERCVKALEVLLLRYDLPDTKMTLQLEPATVGHVARLRGMTPYGLETVLDLEIPAANPFAHDVRVDRFMEGLEVKVPEVGGWLRKQRRIAPHRLGKHRIGRLSSSPAEVRVELRVGADPHAPGFDVTIAGDKPLARLLPVGRDEQGPLLPFQPDAEDSAKLLQLSDRLLGAIAELPRGRRKLVEARLDGELLQDHARPSTLVERLIDAMAPTLHAIAQHSLSPSELVLRRLLSGDHREEVFVSKAELAHKLVPLPEPRRALFLPLGLLEWIPEESSSGDGSAGNAQAQAPYAALVVEEQPLQ